MKRTIAMRLLTNVRKISVLVCMLFFMSLTSIAHTLTMQCWNTNGTYNVSATLGSHNGKIEVTTYTNASMSTIVPGGNTHTYFLNSSGSVNFTVPQPSQNTPVYVYVKWFKPDGNGGYLPDNWNNGNPTSGKYTTTCLALAIKTLEIISAKNVKNTTIIMFKGESTTDNEQIVLNFTMPDGTMKYVTVLFWTKLNPEDIWEVTIDNVSKSINIKKL